LGCLAVLAALSVWGINAGMVRYAAQYVVDGDEMETLPEADCVMVLGALVYDDEQLSGVLQDRMDTAIAIYEAGKAQRLLLSGDHGRKDYDEVNAMMDYALEKGVPAEAIFLDHAGFSTYESMYRARDVFCVESAIIVTQQVNLYRAVYAARKLGLEAYGMQADMHIYGNEKTQTIREILARVKDFFYVNILLPEPTYLGDTIPIWGDSALTHDKI
jgi:vancomycin permeability regulator SanA